jgi:hypothetical protein
MRISEKKRAMNIAVAKDVLKMMATMDIEPGGYFSYPRTTNKMMFALTEPNDGKQLQKNIPKIAKHCTVCAKGAIVLAHVHLYNGVNNLPDNIEGYSRKVFGGGDNHADLIETAFEAVPSEMGYYERLSDKTQGDLARVFGARHYDPKRRLRAIMKNIIVNNGVFTPKDMKNKGPQK